MRPFTCTKFLNDVIFFIVLNYSYTEFTSIQVYLYSAFCNKRKGKSR